MGVVEDVDEEGKEEITESEAWGYAVMFKLSDIISPVSLLLTCSTLHNRSGNS
jgi:hypothetical protein